MPISFILLRGYWRLAKQVWATKGLVLIYKAAVNIKSLEKPGNFENFKPPHHPEIREVSQVRSTQRLQTSLSNKEGKNSIVFLSLAEVRFTSTGKTGQKNQFLASIPRSSGPAKGIRFKLSRKFCYFHK